MARYKDIEPIIEFIRKGLNNPDKAKTFGHDAIEILAEIEYAPTADVIEVVRCKYCVHYEADIICEGVGYCNEHQKGMRENNFCSYGERRKENE